MTDRQLLEEFVRTRSESAFSQIVERHGRMVLGVCLRVTGQRETAEDAAQAAFLVLARRAASHSWRTDAGAWLHQVARYIARDHVRSEKRRQKREREVIAMQSAAASLEEEDRRAELLGVVDEELNRLSRAHREVVVGLFLGGRTQAQMAEALGVPPGTIASRSKIALDRLRERLSRRGVAMGAAALPAALAGAAQVAHLPESFAALPALASGFAGKAAVGTAAAAAATGSVRAGADALAEKALLAMFRAKVKGALAVVAVTTILGVGAAIEVSGVFDPPRPPHAYRGPVDQHVFSGGHRNPAVVLCGESTLLTFGERRPQMSAGKSDSLFVKRSLDGGRSWGEAIEVFSLPGARIGNPSPVVNQADGRVWLVFARDNSQAFVTSSADEGKTWERPRALPGQVNTVGPGHGIQLESGRLLVPASTGKPFCFYSDDAGATWLRGGSVDTQASMAVPVELPGGAVYLNMRSRNPLSGGVRRLSAVSPDGGVTWGKPRPEKQLPGVDSHMSAIRIGDSKKGARVLFSGPSGPGRMNLALYVSDDDCVSWKMLRVLRKGSGGYSDLVLFDDGSVGCAWESNAPSYQAIRFARFEVSK